MSREDKRNLNPTPQEREELFLRSYFQNMQSQLPEEAVEALREQRECLIELARMGAIDADREYQGDTQLASLNSMLHNTTILKDKMEALAGYSPSAPLQEPIAEILTQFLSHAVNAVVALDAIAADHHAVKALHKVMLSTKHVRSCALAFQDVSLAYEIGRKIDTARHRFR